jgi:hypothetical protein
LGQSAEQGTVRHFALEVSRTRTDGMQPLRFRRHSWNKLADHWQMT